MRRRFIGIGIGVLLGNWFLYDLAHGLSGGRGEVLVQPWGRSPPCLCRGFSLFKFRAWPDETCLLLGGNEISKC